MPVQHLYPVGKGRAPAFTEVHLKTSPTNALRLRSHAIPFHIVPEGA
jgi:hypothetical protein